MNVLQAILFPILIVGTCWGTTVVVLWTPAGSVLGTDSKTRSGNGKDAGGTCKIGVSDNVLWAQAGVLGARNSGIDFRSILTEELSSPGTTIDSRISKAESRISLDLAAILNAPMIKASALANLDRNRVQIVIAAYENGVSRMLVREFLPRHGSTGNIEIDIGRDACPDALNCGRSQYLGLGIHDEADKAVQGNPKIWESSPKRIIEYLIDVEIKTHRDAVGPPIAIVRIDAAGIHWVTKGACADK